MRPMEVNGHAAPRNCQIVLFDLDGTLVDSAPDLGGAGNDLRRRLGLEDLPLEDYRPMTGAGARGMLGVALGVLPEDPRFESLKTEYLDLYAVRMTRDTRIFDGMGAVLNALESAGRPWGVVTARAPCRSVTHCGGPGSTARRESMPAIRSGSWASRACSSRSSPRRARPGTTGSGAERSR